MLVDEERGSVGAAAEVLLRRSVVTWSWLMDHVTTPASHLKLLLVRRNMTEFWRPDITIVMKYPEVIFVCRGLSACTISVLAVEEWGSALGSSWLQLTETPTKRTARLSRLWPSLTIWSQCRAHTSSSGAISYHVKYTEQKNSYGKNSSFVAKHCVQSHRLCY